jgi:uncharacterized protein (DUF1501 family)
MDRRFFLKGAALTGCSIAAHPLTTTLTLAEVPSDQRLVVIILRGAMDGLDVLRPVGAPGFADLRPTLLQGEGPGLDGFYALHPALAGLLPLWDAGEVAFAQAVATPYRDKRSHFDGQDLLEAGTGMDVLAGMSRDGWLNRMLQVMPRVGSETAYAFGRDSLQVLAGAAPTRQWSPGLTLAITAQNRRLLEQVYHDDPLFRDAALEAIDLAEVTETFLAEEEARMVEEAMEMDGGGPMAAPPKPPVFDTTDALVDFAASRLAGETRIAAFSQIGWDTHAGQPAAILPPLQRLEASILRLRSRLGPVWRQTTLLAMTEFGRTVRENGTRGTDHGTGGMMLMAGGAIRGGRVYGTWPGIGDGDLYAGRDLMPTSDVRAYAAWAMRGLFGLDRGLLERTVFPGLDMGTDPGLIL